MPNIKCSAIRSLIRNAPCGFQVVANKAEVELKFLQDTIKKLEEKLKKHSFDEVMHPSDLPRV